MPSSNQAEARLEEGASPTSWFEINVTGAGADIMPTFRVD